MLRMKSIGLAVLGLLLISVWTFAAPPQDYSIGYAIKNPDGTVSSYIRYYLSDGNRFRAEYLSADGVAHTVNILRKDKGLVWSLDPKQKTYSQVALRPDAWENAVSGVAAAETPEANKVGTTEFLGYTCDIYEVESEDWANIVLLESSMNVILRSETKIKGQTFQIREATFFSPKKPAASLFEVPAGYRKQ